MSILYFYLSFLEVNKDEFGAIIHSWILLDPSLAKGMAGEIAWDKDAIEIGQVYPSIFRNSIEYMDVNPNLCMMAAFRDPHFGKDFHFPAVRLEGINDMEPTLKPSDFNERRNGDYRPQVGFTRDRPYANLSDAGHRMLQHNVRGNGNQGGYNRGNGNQGGYNRGNGNQGGYNRGNGNQGGYDRGRGQR